MKNEYYAIQKTKRSAQTGERQSTNSWTGNLYVCINNAWDEYKDPADSNNNNTREETAHKVAWSAVKTK